MKEKEAKWFAVYTKPRWEKKVAEELTRFQIESYCPLNKVHRTWSDRKKMVQVPLFTSYVFVHLSEKQLRELYKVNGVLSIVNWLGKPAVIKDQEIETIKQFLNEHTNVKLEKSGVHLNDQIRISSGTFLNTKGQIVAIKNNVIQVELETLGYTMYVAVDSTSIAKV